MTELQRTKRMDVRTSCPTCLGTGLVPRPSLKNCKWQDTCTCGVRADSAPGTRWYGNTHPMIYVEHGEWVALVDEGIAEDVLTLWRAGIETWVSCQGDPENYRYLSILDSARAEEARALLPWAVAWADRTDETMGDFIFRGDLP